MEKVRLNEEAKLSRCEMLPDEEGPTYFFRCRRIDWVASSRWGGAIHVCFELNFTCLKLNGCLGGRSACSPQVPFQLVSYQPRPADSLRVFVPCHHLRLTTAQWLVSLCNYA
jgi:hypothetical protein